MEFCIDAGTICLCYDVSRKKSQSCYSKKFKRDFPETMLGAEPSKEDSTPRILLTNYERRIKRVRSEVRQVSTICQNPTRSTKWTKTYAKSMTFHSVGNKSDRITTGRKRRCQIRSGCSWLLHQMGGSRATGHYHDQESPKFCCQKYHLQIWTASRNSFWQRNIIW